jgi:hypothetical protein
MAIPYSGGPIVRCPLIYTSFWGPSWTDPAHTALSSQINQFLQDLLVSPYMNVLTQYGVFGGGAFVQASYLLGVSGTLTVSGYQAIIQDCIDVGALPEPDDPAVSATDPILIIFLDEKTIINGGGRQLNFPGAPDLGYHDSFKTTAGHPCIYAFVGSFDLTTTTWVTSHEFAEMITDPLYNAWTPNSGFTEIGDLCEGNNDTITVGGRTWTVQTNWSDADNGCRGTAPSPLPAISPGPGGAGAAGAATLGVEVKGRGPRLVSLKPMPYDRLLPLPPIYVDLKARTVTTKDDDVHVYTRKLFYPLRHDRHFKNLPTFLRETAAAIERRVKAEPKLKEPPTRRAGGVAKP